MKEGNTKDSIDSKNIVKLNYWYSGNSSRIFVPIEYGNHSVYRLDFTAKVYKPEMLFRRFFDVFCNGKFIRRVFFYSKEFIPVSIELSAKSPGNDGFEICFETEDKYSPLECGESNDQRNLFLIFSDFKLSPLKTGVVTREDCLNAGRALSKDLFSHSLKSPSDDAIKLVEVLRNAIAKKAPFSMVRFGDGEGRILGYPNVFDVNEIKTEVLRYQFGKSVFDSIKEQYSGNHVDNAILDLKYMLIDSMCSADVVGLPSWLHFRNELTEKNYNGVLGQAAALVSFSEVTSLDSVKVFDHFIFRRVHQDRLFGEVLKELEFIGLVSHSDITGKLKEKFLIKNAIHHSIPGHQSFMKTGGNHFPCEYEKIIRSIQVPYAGAVFLVAAGYLGKVYCTAIKQKGGIAIDIGSIFDGWTGLGRKSVAENTKLRL